MDFVSNQEPQIQEMLAAIGVESIDALFAAIPRELRLPRPAEDDGISEFEGIQLMESLGRKNTFPNFESYLGAGAYEHHVPALVDAVCSRSEFLTAYTPYQPETSQGMLQAMFEFQSAICALTGMDVSNASVYDGASACAEALLMALRIQKRRTKILIAESLHPHYRAVVDQYLESHPVELITISFKEDGTLDCPPLDDSVAAILVAYPNFLGVIEEIKPLFAKAHEVGALTIVSANPLAYGLFASAKELGADIAVGDCQPFGIALQYGGPYAGYIACKEKLVRQIPGRIVGETVDTEGRRGFVLTLQAREQHIRREKATSNICTNQALAALASLVAMLWYGKEGVPKLALTNYQRASYLKNQLGNIPGMTFLSTQPHFNEFAVKLPKPISEVYDHFRQQMIEPGIDLGRFYPRLKDHLLITVTETKNQEQLDRYCQVMKEALA